MQESSEKWTPVVNHEISQPKSSTPMRWNTSDACAASEQAMDMLA